MAVAFVKSTSNTATANWTTTGCTPTFASAATSGNLVIVVCGARGNRTFTPSDEYTWTAIPNGELNNGTNCDIKGWYRIAGGSEVASQGNFQLDTASIHGFVIAMEFSGVDTSSPFATSNSQIDSATSHDFTTGAVSSTETYGLAWFWCAATGTDYSAVSAGTLQETPNTGGGTNVAGMGAYQMGVTGSTTYSRSSTSASAQATGLYVVIKPAPTSVDVTPAAGTLNLSAPNPTVTLGSTSVTPAATTVNLSAVTPTVTLGAVTVTPAAANLDLMAANAAVTLGATSVSPAAATLNLSAVDPTVTVGGGGTEVAVAAAEITLTAVTPTVTLGAVTVTPAAATLLLSAPDPTVSTGGSETVAPAAATVLLTAITPTVVISGLEQPGQAVAGARVLYAGVAGARVLAPANGAARQGDVALATARVTHRAIAAARIVTGATATASIP